MTPLLADLVEAHDLPTHDRWIVLAPDSTVPALTDETRTLSVAGSQGSGRSPPPTRSRARSTQPAASGGAYVVHADRAHPVATRLGAARADRRARAAALVGDRARRADARDRARARRARLPPRARLPAGVARAAARRARARPRLRRDALARADGAAPLGDRALRDRVGRRRSSSATRSSRACGSSTRRTAASSAGRRARPRSPSPRSCSAVSARRTRCCRRPCTSTGRCRGRS